MSSTAPHQFPNGTLSHDPSVVDGNKEDGGLPHTLPSQCVEGISKIPKLTREQCGHIRHFHNLASQPDGEWSLMGSQTGQDWDEAYRYQLASMAYATGAAHYHRLPALKSIFKGLLQKLITKMLHPDVWGYWYLSSQSGIKLDPDLKELRKPWADPVCKENVMYSGHLLLMVSLYTMLFGDDRYDKEDSIMFNWNPKFWGFGAEHFSYTRMKLQETILTQMERSGWMGACCEPNKVFIVCNQFPITATRYNDFVNNTNDVENVIAKYKQAWASWGMISENGLFRKWYSVRQDSVDPSQDISHSAWIMAFMPWNHAHIKTMYPTIGAGFLQHISNRINIRPPILANAIRKAAASSNRDPESPGVLEQAHNECSHLPINEKIAMLPTFGYVAQWLSEIAGPPDVDSLLRHADQYLRPTWRDGGLYYARNDVGWDTDGNYVHVEPYTGNAAIGYARLNVEGGGKKMFDHPWTRAEVQERPYIEGGVDFTRGVWIREKRAMVVTLRCWEEKEVDVGFVVKMLLVGRWGVYVDERLMKVVDVNEKGDDVCFDVSVGAEDMDIVLVESPGVQ